MAAMNTLCLCIAFALISLVAPSNARAARPGEGTPATDSTKAPLPPDFALIPTGEFAMSNAIDGQGSPPWHKVSVSAFYVQKTEVTKALWDEVREWGMKHGYPDLPVGKGKAASHPVQTVTWYDVVKWCNARSEKEGLTPCYFTESSHTKVYRKGNKDLTNGMVSWNANGYRLPTEAEWEKAARGGLAGKIFPWGDTISHRKANFNNSGEQGFQTGSIGYHPTYKTGEMPYTSPVGSFPANGYGLKDMVGNVNEWCWDRYRYVDHPAKLETDPRGPAGGLYRILRGGSWYNSASGCCVGGSGYSAPDYASYYVGFRPVRSSIN